jgi:hypothetical protein
MRAGICSSPEEVAGVPLGPPTRRLRSLHRRREPAGPAGSQGPVQPGLANVGLDLPDGPGGRSRGGRLVQREDARSRGPHDPVARRGASWRREAAGRRGGAAQSACARAGATRKDIAYPTVSTSAGSRETRWQRRGRDRVGARLAAFCGQMVSSRLPGSLNARPPERHLLLRELPAIAWQSGTHLLQLALHGL